MDVKAGKSELQSAKKGPSSGGYFVFCKHALTDKLVFLNYSIGTIQTASVLSDEVYIETVAVILIKVAGTCSI